MPKKQRYVDATEAKNQFGAIMNQALLGPVVITSRRRPKVVLLSYAAFQQAQVTQSASPKLTFAELMKDLPVVSKVEHNLSETYKDVLYETSE